MSTPDWLRAGAVVWDEEGERWEVRDVGVRWIEVRHARRGGHELLREDLIEWVAEGEWGIPEHRK